MRFAILTRPDYRSPRILAESLKSQLKKSGHDAKIFFNIESITRLKKYRETNKSIKYHFWLRRKYLNIIKDLIFLRKLKKYDAIIISECSPNGFWRDLYHIEKFKEIIKKPVLFHEVYYLGNAPTQIENLKKKGDQTIERYDFHLAVSDVTEIKSNPNKKWSCVGLALHDFKLTPAPKDEFIALLDFSQPGFEEFANMQKKVLTELGIKTICLSGNFTFDEIRSIYQHSAILFIQFPEAFGLPIAECLASGVQIFTPNSGWPMAWRLDEKPEVHKSGVLPQCFTVYDDEQDLKKKLLAFKIDYDCIQTPKKIFEIFTSTYPHLYYGNPDEINKVIEIIKELS